MSYNCLNLLEYASDNDANAINYCYLADGTRLSVTDVGENGLYYLGSLVYEKHANTIGLESAGFSSGRIVATAGNDTEIRYFLTDHLGSVRVVATDQNNVLERNDYQPFGKRWVTPSMPVSDNRDRFNGKEDQSFAGCRSRTTAPECTTENEDGGSRKIPCSNTIARMFSAGIIRFVKLIHLE